MNLQIILSTCPRGRAEALATTLLDKHLAACVNIVPGLRSLYRWQGKLCDDSEEMLIIKTARAAELLPVLRDIHPYDVPEIIELQPQSVLPDYLQWAIQQCQE